jgi:membrane-associated protease RseP (regulator of RpoE activity)
MVVTASWFSSSPFRGFTRYSWQTLAFLVILFLLGFTLYPENGSLLAQPTSGSAGGGGRPPPPDSWVMTNPSGGPPQQGEVRRGWIGVSIQEVTPDIARALGLSGAFGALIAAVDPGGPAKQTGLQQGDVIVEINRQPIASPDDLAKTIFLSSPGEVALLLVRRGQTQFYAPVTVAAPPGDLRSGSQRAEPPRQETGSSVLPGTPSPREQAAGQSSPPSQQPPALERKAASVPSQPKAPTIQIHSIQTNPQSVAPGATFNLGANFTVTDPALQDAELRVQFSIYIMQGKEVLYRSQPILVTARNGTIMQRIEPLIASKDTGSYRLVINLQYKDKVEQGAADLQIR